MFQYVLYYAICIPVQTLCTIGAIIIIGRLIFQFQSPQALGHVSSLYRNATYACVFGALMCLLLDLSHVYYCFITEEFLFDPLLDKIWQQSGNVPFL